jgi:hypothetical protein
MGKGKQLSFKDKRTQNTKPKIIQFQLDEFENKSLGNVITA